MIEVPITLSLDELWLCRSLVRHAMPGVEQWNGPPPASIDLNSQICEAILVCEESIEDAKTLLCTPVREYTILLSKADCLILDYVVPQDAKTSSGKAIGKEILLKVMAARRALDGGFLAAAEEPTVVDMDERLEEWNKVQALKRRPRKRSA